MKRIYFGLLLICFSIGCAEDALLSPAELDQTLTVENAAFEHKDAIASLTGSVNLDLTFGKRTLGKILVRNTGPDLTQDRGVRMTIIIYDAEGRPIDSGSDTLYGILGNGRITLFELSLEPAPERIKSYTVTFEMKRR